MTEDAKNLLARIAQSTSLRYAIHLITMASLVCIKRQVGNLSSLRLLRSLPSC